MASTSSRCTIYSRTGKLPKPVADCLGDIRVVTTPPEHADYYVTGGRLSPAVERGAAQLEALPVCLPTASSWLHQQVVKKPTAVLVWHSP